MRSLKPCLEPREWREDKVWLRGQEDLHQDTQADHQEVHQAAVRHQATEALHQDIQEDLQAAHHQATQEAVHLQATQHTVAHHQALQVVLHPATEVHHQVVLQAALQKTTCLATPIL